MSWIVVFLLSCVLAASVITRFALSRQARDKFAIMSPGFLGRTWIVSRAMGECWLTPALIVAMFIGLSGRATREWSRLTDQSEKFVAEQPERAVLLAEQVPSENASELAVNRPQWTNLGDVTRDDERHMVLVSRLWSTEEEANQELRNQVMQLVHNDFESKHHGLLDPHGSRFLDSNRIVDVAVKDRYVELIQQNSGKFSFPMTKVWWRVELSPMVRTEIYPAWKTAAVENRIIALGLVFSLVTLLANSMSLFATLKSCCGGGTVPATGLAGFMTAASVAGWAALELFVAARLLA